MYGGIHNAWPSLSRSVERMGVIECHLPATSDKRQEHKEAPLAIAICLAKNNSFGEGRCMKCKTVRVAPSRLLISVRSVAPM